MKQTIEKFPIGPGETLAGDHVTESQHDRLSETTAGLLLGRKMGSSALHDVSIQFTPHPGYRQYFENDQNINTLSELENEDAEAANFPTVRYARGWAQAERAMTSARIPFDERLRAVQNAAENWQLARDLIPKIHEAYPGRFLLWPCSNWRYQLAVDCAPTVLAIADQRDRQSRKFDHDLIQQSRLNVRDTLQSLVKMYEWTESQEGEPGANISRLQGRKGAILGVALEAASLELVQRAAGNKLAVISPSLRLDNAGSAGADLAIYTNKRWVPTAQVKNRVRYQDRKKYTRTNLICGKHHLSFPGEPVINTLRAIADNTRQDELDKIGYVALNVTRGSREYGCSPSQTTRPISPQAVA